MSNFEFINYLPTPGEKHLGVVTIRAYGKIFLSFKIMQAKDGETWYPNVASIKVNSDAEGKDIYKHSFVIDSRYENDELRDLIRANVNPYAQEHRLNAQISTKTQNMGNGSPQPKIVQNSPNNQQNRFYQSNPQTASAHSGYPEYGDAPF